VTPHELKMRYSKDTLTLYYKEKAPQTKTFDHSMEALPILNRLADELEGFELQQGTMDDVFLAVTGKSLKGGAL
ncbi:MAG: hypothetical protein ACLUEW_12190, partial [Lachnospiraceae bacterium]